MKSFPILFSETATRIFTSEFVERGDRVKYSKELMGQDEMKQLLNTALHIVEDTHMRLEEEKMQPLPANAANPK